MKGARSGDMKVRKFDPCPQLAPFVKSFWIMTNELNAPEYIFGSPMAMCPDGYIDIVFILGAESRYSIPRKHEIKKDTGLILGIITENHTLAVDGNFIIAGIKIFPHSLGLFFDIEAGEITDALALLSDAGDLSYEEMIEKLQENITDTDKTISILEDYMLKKLHGNIDDKIKMIDYSIKTIKRHNGSIVINKLAGHLGLSKRLLEMRFEKLVGVGPKLFSRIIRINQAALLDDNDTIKKFIESSLNLGFFDQSHYIKEFKKFTGMTPKQYYELCVRRFQLEKHADAGRKN